MSNFHVDGCPLARPDLFDEDDPMECMCDDVAVADLVALLEEEPPEADLNLNHDIHRVTRGERDASKVPCADCGKTLRLSNLYRHQKRCAARQDKAPLAMVTCECGKTMQPWNVKRHKANACPLRNVAEAPV